MNCIKFEKSTIVTKYIVGVHKNENELVLTIHLMCGDDFEIAFHTKKNLLEKYEQVLSLIDSEP